MIVVEEEEDLEEMIGEEEEEAGEETSDEEEAGWLPQEARAIEARLRVNKTFNFIIRRILFYLRAHYTGMK